MSKGEKTPLQQYYQWENVRKVHVAKCIKALHADSVIEPRIARAYEMILKNIIDGQFPNVEVTEGQQKSYLNLIKRMQKKYPNKQEAELPSLEQSVAIVRDEAVQNPISHEEADDIIKKDDLLQGEKQSESLEMVTSLKQSSLTSVDEAGKKSEAAKEVEEKQPENSEQFLDLGMSMVFVEKPTSESEASKDNESKEAGASRNIPAPAKSYRQMVRESGGCVIS